MKDQLYLDPKEKEAKSLKGILIFIGIVVVAILLFASLMANAEEKGTAQKIHSWLMEAPQGSYDVVVEEYPEFLVVFRIKSVEKDISNFDYRWRWDVKAVRIIYLKRAESDEYDTSLYVEVRQYQSLTVNGCRQYIEWGFYDYQSDGIVDEWSREFMMTFPKEYDDRETGYYYIIPNFPEEMTNKEWRKPSKEEAQKLYEQELGDWLKISKEPPKIPM